MNKRCFLKTFSRFDIGIGTDLLIYSLVVPVVPFQLESLGYTGVSNLVGWLLFAFVSGPFSTVH
jgi:hypothetical protein